MPARRLLGMGDGIARSGVLSRTWSVGAGRCPPSKAYLDRAIDGHGGVVGVVGPPGIGKSRLVREVAAMAPAGVSRCFSRLLRIPHQRRPVPCRGAAAARGHRRRRSRRRRPPAHGYGTRFPTQTRRIWCCLMTCWASPTPRCSCPKIDPDARRRRLTALVNAASLARKAPAVYVVEDAHWIDEVSESMLADFLTVIPQTPSLVLITYRPEYEGALAGCTVPKPSPLRR